MFLCKNKKIFNEQGCFCLLTSPYMNDGVSRKELDDIDYNIGIKHVFQHQKSSLSAWAWDDLSSMKSSVTPWSDIKKLSHVFSAGEIILSFSYGTNSSFLYAFRNHFGRKQDNHKERLFVNMEPWAMLFPSACYLSLKTSLRIQVLYVKSIYINAIDHYESLETKLKKAGFHGFVNHHHGWLYMFHY